MQAGTVNEGLEMPKAGGPPVSRAGAGAGEDFSAVLAGLMSLLGNGQTGQLLPGGDAAAGNCRQGEGEQNLSAAAGESRVMLPDGAWQAPVAALEPAVLEKLHEHERLADSFGVAVQFPENTAGGGQAAGRELNGMPGVFWEESGREAAFAAAVAGLAGRGAAGQEGESAVVSFPAVDGMLSAGDAPSPSPAQGPLEAGPFRAGDKPQMPPGPAGEPVLVQINGQKGRSEPAAAEAGREQVQPAAVLKSFFGGETAGRPGEAAQPTAEAGAGARFRQAAAGEAAGPGHEYGEGNGLPGQTGGQAGGADLQPVAAWPEASRETGRLQLTPEGNAVAARLETWREAGGLQPGPEKRKDGGVIVLLSKPETVGESGAKQVSAASDLQPGVVAGERNRPAAAGQKVILASGEALTSAGGPEKGKAVSGDVRQAISVYAGNELKAEGQVSRPDADALIPPGRQPEAAVRPEKAGVAGTGGAEEGGAFVAAGHDFKAETGHRGMPEIAQPSQGDLRQVNKAAQSELKNMPAGLGGEPQLLTNAPPQNGNEAPAGRVALHGLNDRLFQEIRHRLKIYEGKPELQVKLMLEPEQLGHITVKLYYHKGELSAHFFTGNEAVKEIIESSLQQLRNSLSSLDLKLNEAFVFLGNGSNDAPGHLFYKNGSVYGKPAYGSINHIKEGSSGSKPDVNLNRVPGRIDYLV
ncbi:MAG: flagellar hook-length control protein FliK [Pelotomaculum sp.]|nr:flagellar hook-length control protein FliK [Pelotomaculum sp.]